MKIKTISKIGVTAIAFALVSCSDFLSPETGTTLLEKDNYTKTAQIKASFMGLAASFQHIAEHYMVLTELRSDGVEPTHNAPNEFWQIYNHSIEYGNYLVDPSVYYKVIINCNDFVRHTIKFTEDHPGILPKDLAKGMIADALRFRAWTYLTIGKLYGEAVYYDLALVDDVDVLDDPDYWAWPEVQDPDNKETAPLVSVMKLKDLVDELIGHLNTGVKGFHGLETFNWNDITNSTDVSWNRLGVNVNALMGELHMWRAAFRQDDNNDFRKALDYLLPIVNNNGTTTWTLARTADKDKASWNTDQWAAIFSSNNPYTNSEIITMMPFMQSQQQQNKLQYYYSADSNGYFLKPTDLLVGMYDTNPTVNGVGDVTRKDAAIKELRGDTYVTKFSYKRGAFTRDCPIIVYRAAEIHLMIAECLNHIGLHQEALAFLGSGPKEYWHKDGYFMLPFSNPMFSTNLRFSPGVRGRVGAKNYSLEDATYMGEGRATTSDERLTFVIDSLIADEYGLECSFEAKKYFGCMRMAMFYDKPEYFADVMSRKYGADKAQYYAVFMGGTKANGWKTWFVPYNQTSL